MKSIRAKIKKANRTKVVWNFKETLIYINILGNVLLNVLDISSSLSILGGL